MANGYSYVGTAVGAAVGVYGAGFIDGKSVMARAIGAAIGAVAIGVLLGFFNVP